MALPNASRPVAGSDASPRLAVSDESLAARLREGDQRAFDSLFERYLPRIYALAARHCQERAELEGVVEETFERLLAALDDPRRVEASTFAALALSFTRSALARRGTGSGRP